MTLIVSLRIPDGIVIAGDSLSTMMGVLQLQGDLEMKCPKCGFKHKEKAVLPGIPLPSTTLSYAQKVFPFLGEFGVGAFGLGQLANKTPYFFIRELEKELRAKEPNERPQTVIDAANVIGERALGLLKQQMTIEKQDISKQKDDWRPLGFQVAGYNADQATTIELQIGKDVKSRTFITPGVTVSGQNNVAIAIFQLYKANPQQQPHYAAFSLQDAISYAEFLISTTADYQRFSRSIAGVGGEVDIALITPFDHFVWIRQKSLQSKLAAEARRSRYYAQQDTQADHLEDDEDADNGSNSNTNNGD